MGSWLPIRVTKDALVTNGFVGYAEPVFTGTPREKHCRPGSHMNSQSMPTPETTRGNRENVGQWGPNIVNRVGAKDV
jgi:hypothetical protein